MDAASRNTGCFDGDAAFSHRVTFCVLASVSWRVGMGGLFAIVAISALVSSAAPAFGQGGTTSAISGVVVDAVGGVVPGADVVVRHNATGVTTSAVSNGQGA